MKIELPAPVREIIEKCRSNGFTAYAVGGCVRDTLLGREPDDWDITTSARPEEIKSIFPKTIDTGLKHGTVTVRMDGRSFEVTAFRVDGEYTDGRHPENVRFTDSVREDLARRDFTVNAMAYNDESGIVDPFGGREDLKAGVLRCVGSPAERFREDALRMLRAVRFSAQLGFRIDDSTQDAICEEAERIRAVSAERVRDELTKTLTARRAARAMSILYGTGLMDILLPELSLCFRTPQVTKYHIYDVGTHSLAVMENVPAEKDLRFAALLHDLGKPAARTCDPDGTMHFKRHAEISVRLARDILRRLKFDNRSKSHILRLIQHHDREILPEKRPVKRAVLNVGEDIFAALLDLKRGDALGQNLLYSRPRLSAYDEVERIWQECRREREAFSVSDLAVDGRDVIALGYSGRAIGELLRRLLEQVLERPEDNQKEILLKILEKNADLWLKEIK